MTARWVSFVRAGRAGFGLERAGGIADCTGLLPGVDTLRAALAADALSKISAASAPLLGLAGLTLLPPIPSPAKIICVGLNYRQHAAETGGAIPAHPALFVRFANSVVGHGQMIIRPAASEQFDFEGELAVVIGHRAHHVAPSDALKIVAGYSCFAENSIRDFQRHATTATSGKNFLQSGAWGPAMVAAGAVGDAGHLRVVTRLNGTVMQAHRPWRLDDHQQTLEFEVAGPSASWSRMIFSLDALSWPTAVVRASKGMNPKKTMISKRGSIRGNSAARIPCTVVRPLLKFRHAIFCASIITPKPYRPPGRMLSRPCRYAVAR